MEAEIAGPSGNDQYTPCHLSRDARPLRTSVDWEKRWPAAAAPRVWAGFRELCWPFPAIWTDRWRRHRPSFQIDRYADQVRMRGVARQPPVAQPPPAHRALAIANTRSAALRRCAMALLRRSCQCVSGGCLASAGDACSAGARPGLSPHPSLPSSPRRPAGSPPAGAGAAPAPPLGWRQSACLCAAPCGLRQPIRQAQLPYAANRHPRKPRPATSKPNHESHRSAKVPRRGRGGLARIGCAPE